MNASELAARGLPHGGLWLDRYHIDSIYIAWRNGIVQPGTFDLFGRRAPFGGAFMLAAGLAPALDFAASFSFSDSDLVYLAELQRYPGSFLDWLRDLRFTGSIAALPEGTIAFPNEPLLTVTAPYPEAIALEAGLLQIIGVSTNIATKAARMVLAAEGKALADFSLRRAHNPWLTTRSAMIAGVASTSNVDAARDLGVPASGTVPHALIEAFPTEPEAFQAIAEAFDNYSLLLDTYDVLRAAERAAELGRRSRADYGHRLASVRLDSGDLAAQAFQVRRILDDGGVPDCQIVASGDLDDVTIAALVATGAPIDAYGVGGRLILPETTSADEPASIGAVYKIAWLHGAPEPAKLKLAEDKHTWPGIKQIFRANDWSRDVIALRSEPALADAAPLLVPATEAGEIVLAGYDDFSAIRQRAEQSLAALPPHLRGLDTSAMHPVDYSEAMESLRLAAVSSARGANT